MTFIPSEWNKVYSKFLVDRISPVYNNWEITYIISDFLNNLWKCHASLLHQSPRVKLLPVRMKYNSVQRRKQSEYCLFWDQVQKWSWKWLKTNHNVQDNALIHCFAMGLRHIQTARTELQKLFEISVISKYGLSGKDWLFSTLFRVSRIRPSAHRHWAYFMHGSYSWIQHVVL